ncbi:MAG: cytochrome c3 family protein [Ignavibacteria bacterium]|nr:cytochrome c3 family protein [Ignavibacteria bacterium]
MILTNSKILFRSVWFMILLNTVSYPQILQSKHNLSITGPGTIKATGEQEVCKFCHLPHRNVKVVPLWDHNLSSVTYSQYTSSTFSASYQSQYPNLSSKLCLSCHDGTIAIGSMSTGNIAVSGTGNLDPDQSLAGSASSNIGGSTGALLSDDHPISIGLPHFSATQYNCSGCHYPSSGDKVPMECVRCHDPHNESKDVVTKKFLKKSNSSSALCLDCHKKTYWVTNPSIHQQSTKSLPVGWSHNGYTTVATSGCESCHKPHSANSPARLLKENEQILCEACHKGITNGGITEKNVSASSGGPFIKLYKHPTYSIDNKHRPVNASPATNSPTESSADVSTPNRHAECGDCHNPHAAKSGLHTTKTNATSNVLSGVWGLEPTDVSNWMQPTSFTRIDPASKEYQICFKCHSYYGLGTTTTGVTTIIGPSGTNITDQAMEYNVNNFSAHPVKVGSSSQTGSYSPKNLLSSQMSTTWNSVGSQTMYCSDCHGNDQATSATVPQGPHGSNYKYMLTGTAKYWPANAAGYLWTVRDIKNNLNNWQTNLFCVNCHPIYSGGTWMNNVHAKGNHQGSTVYCITCHVVVPHGSKRSRLIGYQSDPAPYNYNGTGNAKLLTIGFKKEVSPNNYSDNNCSFSSRGVCHGVQTPPSGSYDQ